MEAALALGEKIRFVRTEKLNITQKELSELQWVDLFPDFNKGFDRIMAALNFRPSSTHIQSLIGTTWIYNADNKYMTEIEFLDDKKLAFTELGIRSTNAHWEQNGNSVYFEINNKYAQYKGTISISTISGEAQNIKGERWIWSANKRDKK